ncbi:MAG: HEAT repeat domain-containing protein [Candidatus Brocadiia bacterium]
MKKLMLMSALITIIIFSYPGESEPHGPGPWLLPPQVDPLDKQSEGKPQVPPLSSEGIVYDFIGGLIPQNIKKPLTGDKTISVNIYDPNKIGIELLNTYFTPFDPYQLTSVSSLNLPIINKSETFKPLLNLYLKQHIILTILQTMVYVEVCPEAPAAEYLIDLGQPSLVGSQTVANITPGALGANWVKDMEAGKRVGVQIQKAVGEAAQQPPPNAPAGQNQFETMVQRLIVDELGKNYFFPGDLDFAPCLKSLGEEIMPYIIQAAKTSPHTLVKRNAVCLLDQYNSEDAVKALRDILLDKENKDKVIRNRALKSLLIKRDKEIIPFLIEALKDKEDKYFGTMAAYSLGLLGDKQAVKPLMEYAESDPNDRDVLWAAIPALGMLGDNSEEIKTFIKKYVERKLLVTKTLALLSLYALGDDTAAEQLSLQVSENPVRKIEYPALYFAAKTLGKRGEKDVPTLLALVNNRGHDPRLRFAAMCQIKFTDKNTNDLKELINQPKTPEIIKAYALYQLLLLRDKDLIADCEGVLKNSFLAAGRKGIKFNGEGFDAVIAIRILGLYKANKEALLSELISQTTQGIKSRPSRDKDMGSLLPRPPILETAIQELSKINSKDSTKILLDLLKQSDFPCRSAVALALGDMAQDKAITKALISALSDKDSWTRYRACNSLKKITGQDFGGEWVYDNDATRKENLAKWDKWWTETGSKQN